MSCIVSYCLGADYIELHYYGSDAGWVTGGYIARLMGSWDRLVGKNWVAGI